MGKTEFLKYAMDVYNSEPELSQKRSKDKFMALAEKSYEDYNEFQSLKGMTYDRFEQEYMKPQIARFPRWCAEGTECEMCFTQFKGAIVVFHRETENGSVIIVPEVYLSTADEYGNLVKMWPTKVLA